MRRVFLGGKYKYLYALVDDEDFESMNKICWILTEKGYAANPKAGRMHRLINNTPKGLQTDHINGNKLDNRRTNLRTCTNSENHYNIRLMTNNTSGHKGVSWSRAAQKWHAYINKDKKRKYLGVFDRKEDAIQAYQVAALELHGEFVRL